MLYFRKYIKTTISAVRLIHKCAVKILLLLLFIESIKDFYRNNYKANRIVTYKQSVQENSEDNMICCRRDQKPQFGAKLNHFKQLSFLIGIMEECKLS